MTDQPPNGKRQGNSNHSPPSGSIHAPPTVFAQLQALRESGVVNMYTEVHAGLEHFGFKEALQWIETNPEMYFKGFSRGFTPTHPDAVEEIDSVALRESVPDEPPTPTRTDASTPNEQYLLDHLQSLRRFSERANAYYTDGSWRKTVPLTDEEREIVDLFDTAVDYKPRKCYRNALLTAATFGGSHNMAYVEGYINASSFVSPVEHAWVELRGKVIELTFPEGPQADADAAYLGIEFPLDDVKAKTFDEGIMEPLID